MKKTFEIYKNSSFSDIVLKAMSNLFLCICIYVALSLCVFAYSTIECEVIGTSMQPTYNTNRYNDWVFVNKYSRNFRIGDIIVISHGEDNIIKRVVGLPGDVLDVVYDNGEYRLERNGEIVVEDYLYVDDRVSVPTSEKNGMIRLYDSRLPALKENKPEIFDGNGKIVVGENQVFALGDHREVSLDSMTYGSFDYASVVGVVESSRSSIESDFEFYYNYVVGLGIISTLGNLLG